MEGYASTPLIFLSTFVIGLIQFILILRFIFELTKVNFYNPVSQMVIKFTNPILKPIRIIPLYLGRVDLGIILILTIITAIKIFIPYTATNSELSLMTLLLAGFGKLINEILDILWWIVVIGAIGSWLSNLNSHPIFNLIDDICDPFYNTIRKILPPMSGLDFSPIILLVLITLTELIIVPPIYHLASQF